MRTDEALLRELGFGPTAGQRLPLAVCSDFDGTVTVRDLSLATLKTFGKPEWRLWEARWRRGEISSDENMRRQFAAVDGDEDAVRAIYEAAEVASGFRDCVLRCRALGIPFLILSDGLDLYIRIVLRRMGLGDVPFVANHAEAVDGRFRLTFPHRNGRCGKCGTCKSSFVRALKTRVDHVVYVGDGHSDRCASGLADTLYARGELARWCARRGRDFVLFEDFHGLLRDLAERRGASGAPQ